MRHHHVTARGLTIVEMIASISCVAVLMVILIPTLGMVRGGDQVAQSIKNLTIIGAAHFTYAGDWNGRQWTVCPDILSKWTPGGYPTIFPVNGPLGLVPSVPLGFNCDGDFFETRNAKYIVPFHWPGNCSLGNFRAWNTGPFNAYVNGRVFDPIFWAPRDRSRANVEKYFDLPCEWPGDGLPPPEGNGPTLFFPTYCMAMSAQYDSLVYANDLIGQTHALDLPLGHRAPSLSKALYPDQKTFMLEHYWLQNIPAADGTIPGAGNVQWFFNMGRRSEPVTLFYDGHVRLLAHLDAIRSDERVQQQGGPSLIASTDPRCFGSGGYFESYSFNDEDVSSYHIFTADGILGRDTIIPE